MNVKRYLKWVTLALAVIAFAGWLDPGGALAAPVTTPGSVPDYFETPNWAFSPPLRKFVDSMAPLGCTTPNNLGQCIPIAVPDTTTYNGSDYYELELVEFREQMHSDLAPLNGTPLTASSGGTLLRGYRQTNTTDPNLLTPHYLGPLIIAQKDRPVRIKFVNSLPTGAGGDLFIPVDTSIMGSGPFEINFDPETKASTGTVIGDFTQNRANLHLHGGRTPWISDGTPHQWITPAGETTTYPKGVSVSYVPDMWFDSAGQTIDSCAGSLTCGVTGATNNPGPGAQTYYYTNQQSARLLFYHDHAWGITRLNVYAGMAAGYLIQDATEDALVAAGTIPADQIPLVIQDKTFVDADTIATTDPTWAWGSQPWNGTPGSPMTPVTGDLWWPHVYMPAQNPYAPDGSGVAPLGRWVYGPWFFPPTPLCGSSPDAVKPLCIDFGTVPNPYYDPNCVPDPGLIENNNFCQPPEIPGTPNVSWGAEAFLDVMTVNGTAYPTLTVDPKKYRLRILNAAHDRFVNLQLYQADASVPLPDDCPTCAQETEVRMVPAAETPGFPEGWPADGREGGVPDPTTRGPAWIQIGTEGGFSPQPVVLPNRPILWNTDPTLFTAGLVLPQSQGGGTLFLGPAERADVIVDFTQFAGRTLILYNDAPAPWPALDPHYDYYTGAPDRTEMGGAAGTPVGRAPNIRTIMQIKVSGSGGAATPDAYDPSYLTNLEAAFRSSGGSPGVFESGQDPIVVGQAAYNTAYDDTFPSIFPYWGVSRISSDAISFKDVNGIFVDNMPLQRKAIQDEMGETFDDYGRLSAKLGLEIAFANAAAQNFVLQNFVDPSTEIVNPDSVQIWRVTHNGVDTHPVHFHLYDVQVLNRVGWDGFITLPDPNELGWKDTVRISPLEDTIVALRPIKPSVPFPVPNSVRPLNPAFPLGSQDGFSQIDPLTGGPVTTPVTNELTNLGHEYVWHCHILSHEENDMMRVVMFEQQTAAPPAPVLSVPVAATQKVSLTWSITATADNAPSRFRVERSVDGVDYTTVANINYGNIFTYADTAVDSAARYTYRIVASNLIGDSPPSNVRTITLPSWVSPTATLTAPTVTTYVPGDTISLAATATAGGGTITKVEFYYGGILIGTDTSSPYSRDWTNVPAGSYPLTAKVYNSLGATAVSPAVTVNIVGSAATPSSLTITPASASFGNVGLNGTSLPVTFTISNDGSTAAALTVNSIVLSGTDATMFQLDNGTCGAAPFVLVPAQSCDITVTFSPTSIGLKTASADVTADGGTPASIALTGTGVSAITMAPASVSFGNVAVNFSSSAVPITLSNNGASGLPLTVTGIALAGTDAAMYQTSNGTCGTLPATIASGASCTMYVTFSPTSTALKNASAVVTVTGEPQVSTTLSGTGVTAFDPVRRTLPSLLSYTSLSTAFAAATGTTTLLAWNAVLPAPALTVNSTGTVTFTGGYDALYGAVTGITAMQGVLTIQSGALVVNGLSIQ